MRAHMPLVGHLVREMLSRVPTHVNRDDLLSAGYAALVAAARGFDADRGVPFARFAAARVRGALLDELRGMDWASRSVRQRARRTDMARQELTAELARTPSATEVAERLGCSVEDLAAADDDVHRAIVFSLQGFATGGAESMVAEPSAGPEELLIRRERLGYLRHAVEVLPERLRAVVIGYFFEERPMADIAADLGVTESRVSQLRAEALTLLRDGLNAHLDPALAAQNPPKEGCVARRRAAYYERIAAHGTLQSRLAVTGPDGLPVAA
ncbi:RNA polymerase sigma factor WhiG [Mangrovihabitans endophyticus]|uniref:RNA polymerase sigma factor WhiG n=1 Tax=Mangrovihabitans endophyticus TaxID=1751298 RepID=A0A8J3BZH7_9ACTN|nr:RNA polymerase sigma factor WhiG [Mangrovihabitans endophyticus]